MYVVTYDLGDPNIEVEECYYAYFSSKEEAAMAFRCFAGDDWKVAGKPICNVRIAELVDVIPSPHDQ